MENTRPAFLDAARQALEIFYPDCDSGFAAGSVLRGEETDKSDIDIVVLYGPEFEDIHRHSAIVAGWPVEFFVQNPAAQDYFMEKDRRRGHCVIMDMVANGIAIPEDTPLSRQRREKAQEMIAAGPPVLTEEEMEDRRYFITDTLDDLDAEKPLLDMFGTLANLYNMLGDFYLRAQGRWSGHGKALGRILRKNDAEFAAEYEAAFAAGFSGNFSPVTALAETVLAPYGGRCFAGLKRSAPEEWRSFKGTPQE